MKKMLAGSIILMCVCMSSLAQTPEQLEAYKASIKSQEHFNKVQRETGMPEMEVPTLKEWIESAEAANKPSLMSTRSITQRESIDEKMSRMRKWSNAGIRKETSTKRKVADIHESRRERLSARSVQRADAHRQEMIEAREWAHRNHVKERALLPDGRVIGLVGIRDGIPQYNITYNTGAADTVAVDELWPNGNTGLDLTGANVIVGVWDGGDVQTNHLEFILPGNQSRIIDQDGESDMPISEHPTAVAGTMAATGVSFSGAPKGMSYQSTVWAYDWKNDISEKMNPAYANGLKVSNHSYGLQTGWGEIPLLAGTYSNAVGGTITLVAGNYDCWWGDLAGSQIESYKFGLYTSDTASTDELVYGNPHSLPIWAAGNDRDDLPRETGEPFITWYNGVMYYFDSAQNYPPADAYADSGYDTVSDHGIAKNVLTVGAVNKIVGGYDGTSSVEVAPFSCYGPTDDGRIKPDVVAAGVDLTSPIWHPDYPNINGYYTLSTGDNDEPSYATGTSFASPVVTGAAGLIIGLREQLKPNKPFLSSTLKALIAHTADEAETVGPDYMTGWGLLNAEQAALLVQDDSDEEGKQFIKEVVLNSGDYIEFPVIAMGNEPLKVSIGWTDPAGTPVINIDPTDLMLVNDLDLRIINSAGTTNFPWVLNPVSPSSSATTGDNYRDNAEQVVISSPSVQETYTVRITHKGDLVDDTGSVAEQAVSIILSGIEPEVREETKIVELVVSSASELLEWPTVVGQNYQVQTKMNLMDQTWIDFSSEISATKTNTTWESDSAPSSTTRFYRLIETN